MTMSGLRAQRELDTCVTSGTQTHASDGMATLLVTTREKARELSPRPEIDIRFVGKAESRTQPSLMPEAPALAVQRLLERAGLTMDDMAVVKNHNPFAVNDVIFAKITGYDWRKMNKTGCSLVWGHPQGPTLTRVLIEAPGGSRRAGRRLRRSCSAARRATWASPRCSRSRKEPGPWPTRPGDRPSRGP